MNGERTRAGFGARLLLAQILVVLVGSVTLLVVAFGLAPGLFRDHVDRAVGPISTELATHLERAFGQTIALSLGVASVAATIAALAVGWFVTRRAVRPIRELADAASAVAAGDYTVRVSAPGFGAEFDTLTATFNDLARTIWDTERTRAAILRDLAHELRTPLSTVRGYHEAVADGVLRADRATFEQIDGELARVDRLLDDLATVASAEEGRWRLHTTPRSVAELIDIAARAAAIAFRDKGVELAVAPQSPDLTAMVDDDRIQEVLANLLSNALRHTPTGGRVTLAATATREGVEIQVTDTGDGIAPEHLPRVFERFYRVDAGRSRDRDRDRGGSGIGLAIARALTQAHGGHLRASSPGPGLGATFTLTLPGPAAAPRR